MKERALRIVMLVFGLALGLCLMPAADAAAAGGMPQVAIQTSLGDIVVELDTEKAPETARNFLYYVKSGFYNDTIFHRVIDGFMIQGGDPDGSEKEKTKKRKPIPKEAGHRFYNNP